MFWSICFTGQRVLLLLFSSYSPPHFSQDSFWLTYWTYKNLGHFQLTIFFLILEIWHNQIVLKELTKELLVCWFKSMKIMRIYVYKHFCCGTFNFFIMLVQPRDFLILLVFHYVTSFSSIPHWSNTELKREFQIEVLNLLKCYSAKLTFFSRA